MVIADIAAEIYVQTWAPKRTSAVNMGSLFSKENRVRLSKQQVLDRLWHTQARTFSWCIYRKCDIVRHVGIIIKFDGRPFCTVDFGVRNVSTGCIIAGCVSAVTIRQVTPKFLTKVIQGGDIQCINTTMEECRRYAAYIINKLLTVDHQKQYSLAQYNCRDYTEEVMKRVCATVQCNSANLRATKQMLTGTREEDDQILQYVRFVFATILALLIL